MWWKPRCLLGVRVGPGFGWHVRVGYFRSYFLARAREQLERGLECNKGRVLKGKECWLQSC